MNVSFFILRHIFVVEEPAIPSVAKKHTIYGIWGVVRLVSGRFQVFVSYPFKLGFYLIVIKERERVGEIFGNTILKITKSIILPFARSVLHLTDIQVSELRFM